MTTLPEMIDAYVAGASALRHDVRGMSREQLRARPVPGKWSTLEVICHLADFEPIFADRMKRVIAEERPTLLGADENRFQAALAYQERDADEELAIIEQLFDHLPETAFFMKDARGRYLAVNQSLVERCGCQDKQDAPGRSAEAGQQRNHHGW